MATLFSDDFNRADSGTVDATNWTEVSGPIWSIAANKANAITGGGVGNALITTTAAHAAVADAQVSVTFSASTGVPDHGLLLRTNATATTGYFLDFIGTGGGDTVDIWRIDGPAISNDVQIGTTVTGLTVTAGDIFKFKAETIGATVVLTGYQNNVQVIQMTDSSGSRITTAGQAGIIKWDTGTNDYDDFLVENLADVTAALTGSLIGFSTGTITAISESANPIRQRIDWKYQFDWKPQSWDFPLGVDLLLDDFLPSAGSPDVTVALTGSAVAYSTGTLTPSTDIALTGATYTWNTGTLTASIGGDVTVALTGSLVSLSTGTLTPSSSVALTGSLESYSSGTLTPNSSLTLVGVSEAYSTGVLTPATSISIAGSLVSFSTGTLTAQAGGDVTVALTGIDIGWQTGQLQASGADSAQQSSGGYGFFNDFEIHRIKRQRRKRQEEERRIEQEQIQAELDREIARLLAEQEAKDAERADLERIQKLADEYAGTRQQVPRNIAASLLKAQEERSKNALEQLQRELERMYEEEESHIVALLMLDD